VIHKAHSKIIQDSDLSEYRPVERGYAEHRTRAWVSARIGHYLERDRPDVIVYVIRKLGENPGREFLRRNYLIES